MRRSPISRPFRTALNMVMNHESHRDAYGIRRIRAVLVETLDIKWAEELRQAVTPICPVPLFWFTAVDVDQVCSRVASARVQILKNTSYLRPLTPLQKRSRPNSQ